MIIHWALLYVSFWFGGTSLFFIGIVDVLSSNNFILIFDALILYEDHFDIVWFLKLLFWNISYLRATAVLRVESLFIIWEEIIFFIKLYKSMKNYFNNSMRLFSERVLNNSKSYWKIIFAKRYIICDPVSIFKCLCVITQINTSSSSKSSLYFLFILFSISNFNFSFRNLH